MNKEIIKLYADIGKERERIQEDMEKISRRFKLSLVGIAIGFVVLFVVEVFK